MKSILIMIAIFTVGLTFEQSKVETITIKTSAVCDMCKEKIENELNYTKGVKFAELEVETKMLTVKFKTDKISKDRIVSIVNSIGYDADGKEGDKKAYAELPGCCKKGSKCEVK